MHLDDTIVAVSTPPGRGGIGVVRLSGSDALKIASRLLHSGEASALAPKRTHFCQVLDPASNDKLDEAVVTCFARPHSYTAEDVVEISCHGSPVILRRVVELCVERGARLAEPGEFTMRAFLNGRIDLTQAEAVRDLIEAQTLYQARVAAQQLSGALSHRVQPAKQRLIELIAELEAGIDFAEDDVSVPAADEIERRIAEVRAPLAALASSFSYGKVVQEGLTLAIVGRPNVGKSSLFNRLVEQERAIVTASPGTTRDLVTETVALGGIPLRLVDTAGIRHALDEAESIGIRKSMEALADADLVLVVLDASAARDARDDELIADVACRAAIIVENKCDLAPSPGCHPEPPRSGCEGSAVQGVTMTSELPIVRTSALTGAGIAELRRAILGHIAGDEGAQAEAGFLTNLRQQEAVTRSIAALDAASTAARQGIPHEMLLLDLYGGLRALDELSGATTADDILNLIFGRFCIGK